MSNDETNDPLDGAAVGETRTVRESKTLHGINFEPNVFDGSDRQWRRGPKIVDVDIVENDDGADDIQVTWEADVTKRLPRRWDQCNEPRTSEGESVERRWRVRNHSARILRGVWSGMSFWDVKVYDEDGERETLRGLTLATTHTLMAIFEREGIKAQAMKYNDGGTTVLESESVNWDKYRLSKQLEADYAE